ncbi:PREDICTED: uncharacterized protein LOC106806867 [Priapulus caudatus]|uniref:Uncharacterized protein LOC106806867 n=1 Tax=Priapulus caudatus TaxID=37621 RepID=A0ABM1DX18_PRICU|nr:PREDICTED: uncharacterized protein LOC106806867 [Priapulus caudatus]XP_014664490.1 PREDICTED: uncharacterized protein LOC106806867 [Priapulus caudatus]
MGGLSRGYSGVASFSVAVGDSPEKLLIARKIPLTQRSSYCICCFSLLSIAVPTVMLCAIFVMNPYLRTVDFVQTTCSVLNSTAANFKSCNTCVPYTCIRVHVNYTAIDADGDRSAARAAKRVAFLYDDERLLYQKYKCTFTPWDPLETTAFKDRFKKKGYEFQCFYDPKASSKSSGAKSIKKCSS